MNDAETGRLTIDWLHAFLIGAASLVIVRRWSLWIAISLFAFYDLLAFASLWTPHTGSDCGIHTGNDRDFTGSYIVFQLGYGLLLAVVSLTTLADLVTRAVQWLLRQSRTRTAARRLKL